MSRQLNPYLGFDASTREAMTFYQSVFGGVVELMTFGDYGAEGAAADLVMHAQLTTDDGLVLMASDRAPGMDPVVRGSQVQLCLTADEAEESQAVRDWFAALSEGGEVHTALERQMWGDEYGDLTDRFGQRWMVNIAAAAPAA